MNTFKPDLIIEVTSVCNRACQGCYAPNVVSKESASDLKSKNPELFLTQRSLQTALIDLGYDLPTVTSIRGGEPTLNPDLPELLMTTRFFTQSLYLETHGRWLLKKEKADYDGLIAAIKSANVIIKISFDRMHRMEVSELSEILDALETENLPYLVAITEPSINEYLEVRNSIPFIADEKIIYQQKGIKVDELVRPHLGIINNKGDRRETLTTKFEAAKVPSLKQAGIVFG